MGFYSDFIEMCGRMGDPEVAATLMRIQHQLVGLLPPQLGAVKLYVPAEVPPNLREQAAREGLYFIQTSVLMKRARIVRLLGPQAQVFLDTPAVPGQDYLKWLRLPYRELYIHLDQAIQFSDYAGEYDAGGLALTKPDSTGTFLNPVTGAEDAEKLAQVFRSRFRHHTPPVNGVLLIECPGAELARLGFTRGAEFGRGGIGYTVAGADTAMHIDMGACERVIQVVFLIPLPDFFLNTHAATMCIMKDGQLLYSREGLWQTRKRMLDWAVHLVNFLSSPSVKLVPTEPAVALQKARARRGKPPLPGWYEITYRKVIKEYTKDKFSTKRWEHSFRYDVRGHFARYARGPMAGRVVWIPPHQRGLKHQLYKPKTYRSGDQMTGAPSEVWKG